MSVSKRLAKLEQAARCVGRRYLVRYANSDTPTLPGHDGRCWDGKRYVEPGPNDVIFAVRYAHWRGQEAGR